MPRKGRVDRQRRLVRHDLGLAHGHGHRYVLSAEERVIAAHLKTGDDLVDLCDQLLGQVHPKPIVGLVHHTVAGVMDVPVVKGLHHLLRRAAGRIRQPAGDLVDPPAIIGLAQRQVQAMPWERRVDRQPSLILIHPGRPHRYSRGNILSAEERIVAAPLHGGIGFLDLGHQPFGQQRVVHISLVRAHGTARCEIVIGDIPAIERLRSLFRRGCFPRQSRHIGIHGLCWSRLRSGSRLLDSRDRFHRNHALSTSVLRRRSSRLRRASCDQRHP